MKTNNKIIQLFALLRTYHKDNVRSIVSRKYGKSLDSVKNHWLLKGSTPKIYERGVIEILEKELKKQIEEDKKILTDN